MKYSYQLFIALIVFGISLILSFILGFPVFLFFLPFPSLLIRKKTSSVPYSESNAEVRYCGSCGRARDPEWRVCPFCGSQFYQ